MISALISDVHGNLEALVAVMKDIKDNPKVDNVIFLGDAVGYGANPNEVLAIIDSECDTKIMGNHDYSALGLQNVEEFNTMAQHAIAFTTAVLDAKAIGILASFKMSAETDTMYLVHATPESPTEWNYCLSIYDAERQFAHFKLPLCCLGHSHKPIIYGHTYAGETYTVTAQRVRFEREARYIVNIGSVGQPRDGDPRSCYAIYDSDANSLSYRRVEYDVAKAQAKMAAAKLPEFLIERLANGK